MAFSVVSPTLKTEHLIGFVEAVLIPVTDQGVVNLVTVIAVKQLQVIGRPVSIPIPKRTPLTYVHEGAVRASFEREWTSGAVVGERQQEGVSLAGVAVVGGVG